LNHLYVIKQITMKRKDFLLSTLLTTPVLALAKSIENEALSAKESFVVDAGKSRFGDVIKFLGVHPNDLKISSKDTGGKLSVFDYTGYAKIGPMLHMHLHQDEIFTVIEGEYRFLAGEKTYRLTAGQTIFLPRKIPHTWIQLTDKGRMIYFLQPAGKMEEFFQYMNNLKEPPSAEEMNRIHAAHGMKVVGPPLTL
jgi:quercetin dioxygenase-like cupin family protein